MGIRDLDSTQIAALSIGIITAMGFSLGAIFSYSSQVNTNPAGEQNEFNATLPDQNFNSEAYNLSTREQRVLALRNDVVLLNGFYETQSQREQLEQLQGLISTFDNRVYLAVANSSANSDIIYSYGLTNFPSVVVIGGNQNYRGAPVQQISQERVTEEICDALRDRGDQAGECL